jgi:hypothetical protein
LRAASVLGAILATSAGVLGCGARDPPEVARARASHAFLAAQVADLEKLVAQAEAGDLVTRDRIAIGISEGVVKQLLDAGLPQEAAVGDRVRVRIDSAQPYFRGNNAALVFQATARGIRLEGAVARLELAGSLERVRIQDGKLMGDIQLGYFNVLDTSLGDIAGDVLQDLVKHNLPALTALIPALEIPVHLEQSVDIDGLDEGVVVTRPGVLPLAMTVAEVLPVRERLWVFLEATAGPWKTVTVAEAPK